MNSFKYILFFGLCYSAVQAEVLIEDSFDDGNPSSNNNGIGIESGWQVQDNNAIRYKEENGGLNTEVFKEQGMVALTAKNEDRINFWNEQGVTIQWTVKNTHVRTKHAYGVYFAYVWYFGLLIPEAVNQQGWNQPPGNNGDERGCFWFRVAFKDDGLAKGEVFAISNSMPKPTNPHDWGIHKLPEYRFTDFRADGTGELTATLSINKNGWDINFSKNTQGGKLSGNWTTDLGPASMTDEWINGAHLVTVAWNLGIDGGTNFSPFNTGTLDHLKVTSNGSTALNPFRKEKHTHFLSFLKLPVFEVYLHEKAYQLNGNRIFQIPLSLSNQ